FQYIESRKLRNKVIFHFGTGEHHFLGKINHECGNPNEIIGITACKEEHDAYVDFIVNNPAAANYYKVLYADIYTLSPRVLPMFDIVTLFHLCEYYDEQKSAYARLDDIGLLEMFISKLNPGGRLLFFKGSDGFLKRDRKAARIFDDFIEKRKIFLEDKHET